MHFKNLDLNLLVVLDALLTERSTTRAGERLYLSQSATSGALARLREYFGDPLLIRGPQTKMILTPLAEALAQPVRRMLMQAEDVLTCNAAFDPATSTRRFRLNMGDEVAAVLMTAALAKIRQCAPHVGVEILSHHTGGESLAQELSEVLEQGDLDFLIVPKHLMSPHHPIEPVFTDPFVCVAWKGNRLIKDKISKEQFYSLGHVVTRIGPRRTHAVEKDIMQEADERRVEIIAPTFALKAIFLIGTNLIASMQESLARFCARYMPLKILPLPIPSTPISMHIQWHRYQDHDPGTKWFLSILKECADSIYPKQAEATGGEPISRSKFA